MVAGVLLILMPAVVYGGTDILSLLVGNPEYADNQLRQGFGAPATPARACCWCSRS